MRPQPACAAVLACLTVLAANQPARAAAPPPRRQARTTFLSAGKPVTVERFEPAGQGPCPALLLLHGLDGPGPVYRFLARRLAGGGFVVFLVHYFDRTQTRKESLPALAKQFRACLDRARADSKELQPVRATFESWHAAVGDAVGHVRRQPRVDPKRVGLIGLSMGGFLAIAAAARAELRIACVVELFGGLPPGHEAGLRQMPPTLIIHGDRDTTVPVQEARSLCRRLRALERTCEIHICPGVEHGIEPTAGWLGLRSALKAEQCTMAFLARHLGRPKAEKAAVSRAKP
jgi:dienelactone hydrolase